MTAVAVGGARIDVEQIGSGPELLLLHSLLADRSAFDRVKGELARERRVVLANMPGYGASSPAGASIEEYADHVAGLFPALKLSARTAVLGNGFGGFVALALAARHGAKFDRLIIADSAATFPPPAKEPFKVLHAKVSEQGMEAVLDAAVRRMFPEAFIAEHPEVVAERKAALAEADPGCFARACLALARVDLREAVRAIRNPTLVMVGALDQTTPPGLARELAGAIPGARFLEIPGAGHCPQIEKPAEFVAAVQGFLAAP
ncbi:MAG TPA: alpha/beta fold hydrolase [Burkholderiales bacterium]